jgi:hypothetical protein
VPTTGPMALGSASAEDGVAKRHVLSIAQQQTATSFDLCSHIIAWRAWLIGSSFGALFIERCVKSARLLALVATVI